MSVCAVGHCTHTPVLEARKNKKSPLPVRPRVFKIPELNFDANNYTKMIKCPTTISESPLTTVLQDILNKDLKTFFTGFPCHTVAVERNIRLIIRDITRSVG